MATVTGTSRHTHRILDRLGMSASTICAVHCVALPFALSFLPVLGVGFLAHGTFEIVMISLSFVIGVVSLGSSYRVHGKLNPILMMISGVVILIFNFVGHASHSALAETLHPYIAGLGGLMVATAHRINMKLCSSCDVCVHDHAHDA
jgi:hypothetical protein